MPLLLSAFVKLWLAGIQMLIDVENRVIILDEAHNIEDSAREAASLSITSEELTEVTNEIEEIRELAVYVPCPCCLHHVPRPNPYGRMG